MVLAFTCGLYPAPPCLQYITDTSSRNNDVNKNDVFAISYAGIGKTGKHEYHIMNNNSGTFMTYPEGAPDAKLLTGEVMSPSNDRTRWSVRYFRTRIFYFIPTDHRLPQIIPLRNGSGQYWWVQRWRQRSPNVMNTWLMHAGFPPWPTRGNTSTSTTAGRTTRPKFGSTTTSSIPLANGTLRCTKTARSTALMWAGVTELRHSHSEDDCAQLRRLGTD